MKILNGYKIKKIIQTLTGYWFYKVKSLPIGADLKLDIQNRFAVKNLRTIFDVGANIGQSYLKFRRAFPQSTIYCFEPITETFNKLKNNLRNKPELVFENFAFGDEKGEKKVKLFEKWDDLNTLKDDLMNNTADAPVQIVNIDTIDNYCKKEKIDTIDLLKIDTEGYELNVLKGAREMLEQRKISFIFCEVGFLQINVRNTSFNELSEFLAKFGYYFIGLYDYSAGSWSSGKYFANALFGNSLMKNK